MQIFTRTAAMTIAVLLCAQVARADVTLNSVRVAAKDTEAPAKGTTGIVIGIAIDPVGNRIELIQRAAQNR